VLLSNGDYDVHIIGVDSELAPLAAACSLTSEPGTSHGGVSYGPLMVSAIAIAIFVKSPRMSGKGFAVGARLMFYLWRRPFAQLCALRISPGS
jgi:hypothetical protein